MFLNKLFNLSDILNPEITNIIDDGKNEIT